MEPDSKQARTGKQATAAKKKPTAKPETPVEVEPPKPVPTTPVKKKSTGFVPPPVTDPGF